MITKGEPWGTPTRARADVTVTGSDVALAAAVRDAAPGALVAFTPAPDSDLAPAVGLKAGAPPRGIALPMDVLELDDGRLAVNAVVLGTAPDHLHRRSRPVLVHVQIDGLDDPKLLVQKVTTVVVATGQWLRGVDLVPRGHPGDGKAELQAYFLKRAERAGMRERLPTGTHLPHPRIRTRTARTVAITAARPMALEIDGRSVEPVTTLRATVVPARYRLLV